MECERRRLLPVSVLTGFLGSGKTTVLNHLIRQPMLDRTLVIVNEFGEIGLDHDLMAISQDNTVIEMSSGCLCCTIRGDLVKTLRDAPGRYAREGKLWFDRVVIETTGLADPAPILHTLMTDQRISRRYRLDGIITTVDAVNGAYTLGRQIESAKQAAVADRLLLTKTDLVNEDELRKLQDRLRGLNPAASQLIANNGQVDPSSLFEAGLFDPETKTPDVQKWLRTEAYSDHHHGHSHDGDHQDVNRHDEHIRAFCLTIDDPIDGQKFEAWMDTLQTFQGPNLLRIKGIINVAELDVPVVVHGVQHIFHPPVALEKWPNDDHRSRIVFITRDMKESTLLDTLRLFTGIRLPSQQSVELPDAKVNVGERS